MSAQANASRFEVVSLDTGEVVHVVPCDKTGHARERVEKGLLMRIDRERFFVRDVESAPLTDRADALLDAAEANLEHARAHRDAGRTQAARGAVAAAETELLCAEVERGESEACS